MPKTATAWTPSDSGTATADNAGYFLLIETGDTLLIETGDKFLLEDSVVTTKNPQLWADVVKGATGWKVTEGYSTFSTTTYTRTTVTSDTRITETGDTRVSEGSVETGKAPTIWSEN